MKYDSSALLSHPRHTLQIGEASLVVEDGVFTPDPRLTYSTGIIVEHFPDVKNARVADVGTGCGVLAVLAALRGAREVVATDTSDKAVENARLNSLQNKVDDRMQVLQGDLLEKIEGPFDVLFANLPIVSEMWQVEDTQFLIDRFLLSVKEKITPEGKIYLAWASLAPGQEILEALIEKHGYAAHRFEAEKIGVTWLLYTLSVR